MEIILCETIRYDTDKRNSLFGESVQLATYRLYCYHYLITSLPIYCYGSRGRAAVGRSALLIAFEYPASGGWPPNTRYPLPLSAAILSAFKRNLHPRKFTYVGVYIPTGLPLVFLIWLCYIHECIQYWTF